MRNLLAVLLAAVAVISGANAWAGYRIDTVLTQPDEVREYLGTMVDDQRVRDGLSQRATDMAENAFGNIPDQLEAPLKTGISAAVGKVMDQPQTKESWEKSLDLSRERYVEQVRSGQTGAGSVPLILDPFAGQLKKTLSSELDNAVEKLGLGDLPVSDATKLIGDEWRVNIDISEEIPVTRIAEPALTHEVQQSQYWLIYALVAVAAFVLSLVVAKRRAVAFLSGGVVAVALGAIAAGLAGALNASAKMVSEALTQPFLEGLRDLTQSVAWPVLIGGGVLIVLAIIGLIVGRRRHRSVGW